MTAPVQRRWYLVQTHARAENKAAANLLRQGYTIYLPRYLKKRSHARRIEVVPAPLFPRYLFVAFDVMAERWRAIQSTFGVACLVGTGDAPVIVQQNVIDELHAREDGDGFMRLDPAPALSPGDEIRVIGGIFGTRLGLFEGMADRERVAVLLDLLGRKVRVLLDGGSVVAA